MSGIGGFSKPSHSVSTRSTPPAAPRPPLLEPLSRTELRLTWKPPVDHGASVTNYVLKRLDTDQETVFSRHTVGATVGALVAGTEYEFALRAINSVGASDWSNPSDKRGPVTAAPEPCAQPEVADAQITRADISISKPPNNGRLITFFVVQRRELRPGGDHGMWGFDLKLPGPPGPEGSPVALAVTGLRCDTVYQFRVQAVNSHGPGEHSAPTVRCRTRPPQVPLAPSPPIAPKLMPTSVNLEWVNGDDCGAPVQAHVVEQLALRKLENGSFSSPVMAELKTPPTAHDVGMLPAARLEGLEPGRVYCFRVRCVRGRCRRSRRVPSLPRLPAH